MSGHVIIAGFGRVGQIIGQLLSERLIPFVALDVSAERVQVSCYVLNNGAVLSCEMRLLYWGQGMYPTKLTCKGQGAPVKPVHAFSRRQSVLL